MLTASVDKTARLWDGDGRPLAVLEGHAGVVFSAEFAPDGRRILTASADNTARLWDSDGGPLAVLKGHGSLVNSVVFAPDDGRILTASTDNTARLWDSDGKPLASSGNRMACSSSAIVPGAPITSEAKRLAKATIWAAVPHSINSSAGMRRGCGTITELGRTP
jgi:WD40 repeat protein